MKMRLQHWNVLRYIGVNNAHCWQKHPVGSPNIEWMVLPPALMAATPVGATTIQRLSLSLKTLFKKVVLPVPASPVKNTLRLVFSTMSKATSAMSNSESNVHKDTSFNKKSLRKICRFAKNKCTFFRLFPILFSLNLYYWFYQ